MGTTPNVFCKIPGLTKMPVILIILLHGIEMNSNSYSDLHYQKEKKRLKGSREHFTASESK